MAEILYFNGRFTTTDEKVIGVEDRGLQFGDSIYEVLKFLHGAPAFVKQHFERLERNLAALEIPNPFTAESFDSLAREIIGKSSIRDGLLYTQITRGEAKRQHGWPEGMTPNVIIYPTPFSFADEEKKRKGVAVITLPERRWRSCDLKTTNLLPNAMARKAAARAGAFEGVFIDQGEVTEGASSSFFAVREGRVITHTADERVLPGVVRDLAIGLALGDRIRVDERPIREAELYSLDEAFLTSTSQSVMPVTTIDGRTVGNGTRGAVTERIQKLFDELERDETGTG